MNVQNQFSKNANTYDSYNIIQNQVVEKLLSKLSDTPQHILDIGCGRGAIYKSINWIPEKFIAVDFAQGMLDLHPKSENVELAIIDFNQENCFRDLQAYPLDRIVSGSALQWAEDLDRTFDEISRLNAPVSLAIFTSGTFKTLLETASISPLLRSADEIIELSRKYFDAEYEILNYTLKFSSVRDMFRYMKKSGVGGERNVLSIKQMKELMNNYPLDYLEFEILLVHEKDLRRN